MKLLLSDKWRKQKDLMHISLPDHPSTALWMQGVKPLETIVSVPPIPIMNREKYRLEFFLKNCRKFAYEKQGKGTQ